MGSQESDATEQLNTHTHTHTHTQAHVHTHAHHLRKACPAALPQVANALPTLLPSQLANVLCDRLLGGAPPGLRFLQGMGAPDRWGLL